MTLLALINPVCGDCSAPSFFADHVHPLLKSHNVDARTTNAVGHAGSVVVDTVIAHQNKLLTVILASGDGTLHEIINALSSANLLDSAHNIRFVLVPCGTANALYASLFPPGADLVLTNTYKLQSLNAFLENRSTTSLSLLTTTILPPPPKPSQRMVASVVVSIALHAAILNDSEQLRATHPGIERFKVSAERNSCKWYNGRVRLHPTSASGTVQIYDLNSGSFLDHPDSTAVHPVVELGGPFAYFLSTVNVDRLEPAFRITPLAKSIPPAEALCEVVVMQPLRDPSIPLDTLETRASYASKTWKVIEGAYRDGSHINLRYTDTGDMVCEGSGPSVVEYLRCRAWEYHPETNDQDAHLVCSDGAIVRIDTGGHVICSAGGVDHGLVVFA